MKTLFRLLSLLALSANLYAYTNKPTGIGLVADQLMGGVYVFSDFVHVGCYALGGSFLLASIVKYLEYRSSPLMTPISTVVFLVFAGTLLILFPWFSHYLGLVTHS